MCALSRINSMVYWEKKRCDTVSWLQTSLWQTCSKPFSRHWKKKLLMFQQTLEVHIIALNFYDTSLWIMMDALKKKRKKIFFMTRWVGKFNCQKMTNCLVAKCALISVRYTFLTHSHTWEYKALREKKLNNLLKPTCSLCW